MNDIPQMISEYLAANPDECDQDSRRVLNRIAADPRAHTAINTIAKSTDEIWQLLELCTLAEMVMGKFHVVLTEERGTVERLRRHRQSVDDLRHLIDQASEHSEHPMVDWLAIPETEQERVVLQDMLNSGAALVQQTPVELESADYFRLALNRISALIDLRQQAADGAALQLGVTRKSASKSAAKKAAIGYLATGVVLYFNKPFAQQVAVLAEVALGIGEISEDRVREALKTRRRRAGLTEAPIL
jgi:hypothetical protein